MPIYHVFVINRAGSLIYDLDCSPKGAELEKTLTYPLDFRLELIDQRPTVVFGERDGIKVGHVLLSINGQPIGPAARLSPLGKTESEGAVDMPVLEYLQTPEHYPLSLTFGRPNLSTNEKIILSSMFHSFYAIGAQLSPAAKSTGIQTVHTDQFRLECFQTTTGNKFVVVADPLTANLEQLLRKIYDLYSDFALKNPFYSIDMPIRCELFDGSLQSLLNTFEKSGLAVV